LILRVRARKIRGDRGKILRRILPLRSAPALSHARRAD
jgi:hypothetical protein